MENTTQLLDHGIVQEGKTVNVEANLASAGKRFLNNLIDSFAVTIIFIFMIFLLGMMGSITESVVAGFGFLIYPFWIVYYVIFEVSSGKTIGKIITGTKVVNLEGKTISIGQALGRTLCRFIPFEVFSFLGHKAVGWHDSIPNTRVINNR